MVLESRDLIWISKTSSVQIFSYMWPMEVYVSAQPLVVKVDDSIILVLAPTKELVVQIRKDDFYIDQGFDYNLLITEDRRKRRNG